MSYCSLLKTFASVIIMNITVNLGVINKSSYTPRQSCRGCNVLYKSITQSVIASIWFYMYLFITYSPS